jgi:hypothetical protein
MDWFESYHYEVSGLTLVKGLTTRRGDQFVKISKFQQYNMTLNPIRSDCDPSGWRDSHGAFVVLEFDGHSC